jgi:hypothetical protein
MNKSFLKPIPFFFLLTAVLFTACREDEVYPIEPVIAFESFTKIDNGTPIDQEGILTISFTDGDGDIGLKEEDTIAPFDLGSPYYYNFYIDYYEKLNDTFVKVDLPSEFHARIPFVDADLASEGYKGEIDIQLYINNPNSAADSIQFECYIYDRSLNKSNVIRTPSIFVKKTF